MNNITNIISDGYLPKIFYSVTISPIINEIFQQNIEPYELKLSANSQSDQTIGEIPIVNNDQVIELENELEKLEGSEESIEETIEETEIEEIIDETEQELGIRSNYFSSFSIGPSNDKCVLPKNWDPRDVNYCQRQTEVLTIPPQIKDICRNETLEYLFANNLTDAYREGSFFADAESYMYYFPEVFNNCTCYKPMSQEFMDKLTETSTFHMVVVFIYVCLFIFGVIANGLSLVIILSYNQQNNKNAKGSRHPSLTSRPSIKGTKDDFDRRYRSRSSKFRTFRAKNRP